MPLGFLSWGRQGEAETLKSEELPAIRNCRESCEGRLSVQTAYITRLSALFLYLAKAVKERFFA